MPWRSLHKLHSMSDCGEWHHHLLRLTIFTQPSHIVMWQNGLASFFPAAPARVVYANPESDLMLRNEHIYEHSSEWIYSSKFGAFSSTARSNILRASTVNQLSISINILIEKCANILKLHPKNPFNLDGAERRSVHSINRYLLSVITQDESKLKWKF